ncbi:MAG: hypothetical protein RJA10_3867 [Pseudomonadota bacterium]
MKRRAAMALALAPLTDRAAAEVSQCVAPAKAGGGFDRTCQLVQALLATPSGAPRVVHQPGGIGALTYREVVRGLRTDSRELIAFSSGTLLNLAQGRFGSWQPERVRWVAAIAQDHGVVAVRSSAPWRSLAELLEALRRQPSAVAFAAGGTIGSQDWMKAALLARAAGISHKALRVVAFEGGGDALRALEGGHVHVLCGDAAEMSARLADRTAGVRLLATLAVTRLGDGLAGVPTALEQGVDVRWPILRGVYASADFPDAERALVTERIAQALRSPEHASRVRALGMSELALIGNALEREVASQLSSYRELADRFGLMVRR